MLNQVFRQHTGELRPHSIRKYFKTQMIDLGLQESYVDYFRGHLPDTYHDIQSLGVDKLRSLYASYPLTIKQKTQRSKLDTIKEMIRALGGNPEQILAKNALVRGNITRQENPDDHQLGILRQQLRQLIKNEASFYMRNRLCA
jgi:hypothetical protein